MNQRLMNPLDAERIMRDAFPAVATETVAWRQANDRVLAEPIRADRAQPAHDVSAMDGYAVRLADLCEGALTIAGEIAAGSPPGPLPAGQTVRIFTGACTPPGAEAVIKREDVEEGKDRIIFREQMAVQAGANIRRAGENIGEGEIAVEAGTLVTPAVVAAMVSFGHTQVKVYRRVKVGVLITGDELLAPEEQPEPWQIRDSNGPAIESMLSPLDWIDLIAVARAPDTPAALQRQMAMLLEQCDLLLLSGGVSMGDYDYVPEAVERIGGHLLCHGLAIRPGKPLLAAVGPIGQAIMGLPGNPVSVLVTLRRFGLPVLRKMAGWAEQCVQQPAVRLVNPDQRTLKLWWYRPVRLIGDGLAERVPNKGSGDVVGAARSDGFIEIPAEADGQGPYGFWSWWGH